MRVVFLLLFHHTCSLFYIFYHILLYFVRKTILQWYSTSERHTSICTIFIFFVILLRLLFNYCIMFSSLCLPNRLSADNTLIWPLQKYRQFYYIIPINHCYWLVTSFYAVAHIMNMYMSFVYKHALVHINWLVIL